jgi:uncharacterized phage-associated protein
MMKRIFIKRLEHVSKLGRFVFTNVPVWVENDVTSSTFDIKTTDYGLDGEAIRHMDREIAKRWLMRLEHEDQTEFTHTELHGIQLILDVNATEFGEQLGLDKSTISKIYKGTQPIQKPWELLAIARLKEHLESPDIAGLKKMDLEGPIVSAIVVADQLLRLSRPDEGEALSNLKINKILYYVQGWALALYDQPIFNDSILAYKHGPVVSSVYKKFKSDMAIPVPLTSSEDSLTESQRKLIRAVYTYYGKFSAWKLRDMTHEEEPWVETDQSTIISHERIKAFFRRELKIG